MKKLSKTEMKNVKGGTGGLLYTCSYWGYDNYGNHTTTVFLTACYNFPMPATVCDYEGGCSGGVQPCSQLDQCV